MDYKEVFMRTEKMVQLFYIIYTIYSLIICGITDIDFIYTLPALVVMWMLYLIFHIGMSSTKKHIDEGEMELNKDISKRKIKAYIIFDIISMVLAVIAVRFYTGQNPLSVVQMLRSGESLYNSYQLYFINSGIAGMGIKKLPFVFMLFYVKINLVFMVITNFATVKKIRLRNIFVMFLAVLPHIYVAISRGTNFEYYELLILIVFCILTRVKGRLTFEKVGKKVMKSLIICFIAGILMVVVYCNTLSARGYELNYYISEDIAYDANSLISTVFPTFSFICLNMYSYLGYGLFYISAFLYTSLEKSIFTILVCLVPNGYSIVYGDTIDSTMKSILDVGVRWTPDFISMMDSMGLIVIILILFVMGRLTRCRMISYEERIVGLMLNYFILLQMLSFPVGNFIMSSSANKISVVLLCGWYIVNKKFIVKR